MLPTVEGVERRYPIIEPDSNIPFGAKLAQKQCQEPLIFVHYNDLSRHSERMSEIREIFVKCVQIQLCGRLMSAQYNCSFCQ